MRLILTIIALILTTNINILSAQNIDSLINEKLSDQKEVVETLKEDIYSQKLIIAELKAARDAYNGNIQFYSLLMTIIIALAGFFIAKVTNKQLQNKIDKIEYEFTNQELIITKQISNFSEHEKRLKKQEKTLIDQIQNINKHEEMLKKQEKTLSDQISNFSEHENRLKEQEKEFEIQFEKYMKQEDKLDKLENNISSMLNDLLSVHANTSYEWASQSWELKRYNDYIIHITNSIENGLRLIDVLKDDPMTGFKNKWIEYVTINIDDFATNINDKIVNNKMIFDKITIDLLKVKINIIKNFKNDSLSYHRSKIIEIIDKIIRSYENEINNKQNK